MHDRKMNLILETGVRNARNVGRYIFGQGAIGELGDILEIRRNGENDGVIFLMDEFFRENVSLLPKLPYESGDQIFYVSAKDEPSTQSIDCLLARVTAVQSEPCAIVGIGGGSTLDSAKALSNLLTNGGSASDYQGWDLVRVPGVYKVGVPTLSGTGAEATRTCVMTNKATGLKLGMNSDFTVFDQLLLDSDLTATVPKAQYFFTGMDAWIHCVESLNGSYRNPVGDAFSTQAITLCTDVFSSSEMMSDSNRSKMMVASYLGGCAIATSYVGLVHPFSAGLSVVLGFRHCEANCIAMMAMESFYPEYYRQYRLFVDNNEIDVPRNVCNGLTDQQFEELYAATIIHEKPLTNALGIGFRDILTRERTREIFEAM